MPTFISMLRGINVGGHRKVPMNSLRDAYAELGFSNVASYIQSGNVVFDAAEKNAAKVTISIEKHLEQWLGFPVPVVVRNRSELGRVIEDNPYLNGRKEDTAKLYVMFLSARPTASAAVDLATIQNPNDRGDEFVLVEREVYAFYPNGYGESKLTNVFFEKKLKVSATARNWNTVRALYAMAAERD
jgi:uncharacterized protein (DUF1697 family)